MAAAGHRAKPGPGLPGNGKARSLLATWLLLGKSLVLDWQSAQSAEKNPVFLKKQESQGCVYDKLEKKVERFFHRIVTRTHSVCVLGHAGPSCWELHGIP